MAKQCAALASGDFRSVRAIGEQIGGTTSIERAGLLPALRTEKHGRLDGVLFQITKVVIIDLMPDAVGIHRYHAFDPLHGLIRDIVAHGTALEIANRHFGPNELCLGCRNVDGAEQASRPRRSFGNLVAVAHDQAIFEGANDLRGNDQRGSHFTSPPPKLG